MVVAAIVRMCVTMGMRIIMRRGLGSVPMSIVVLFRTGGYTVKVYPRAGLIEFGMQQDRLHERKLKQGCNQPGRSTSE